jgi:integrase
LTPEQVGKFLATIAGHQREALYALALDSGMRQGELFGLLRDCVDLDAGAVTVKRSLAHKGAQPIMKDVKTDSSRRRIRILPRTVEILRRHLATRPTAPDTPVFATLGGKFLQPAYISFREFPRLLKKAGLPRIRFHDMRHTCATLLLLKGVNVKAVSARLGHSTATMTLNTYAHTLPAMDEQILEVMGEIMIPDSGAV